jgi:hypothetical protein
MEDQMPESNQEETPIVASQDGKSKIFFIILTFVILLVGGLVGYYIIEQQKFLDNEVDRLVIDDQGRVERKVIRSLKEKLTASVLEEKDWDSYMVGGYFFAPYPTGWHLLVEQGGEGTYTVSYDKDPVIRTEGGHYDPVTIQYSPTEVGESLEIDTEVVKIASTGQEYYVSVVEKQEDGAWFESSITYEAIVPDATGKEYYRKIQFLSEHPALVDLEIEDFMEQFEKVNTL